MSYPVKLFSSVQSGAPTLSGTPGSLIALLDACLINGFNLQTISGITRAGSTATASCASHGYAVGDIVLIAGADQAEYNGEHKVMSVTGSTFDFAVTGTPASPATGVISSKIAPMGDWVKAFTGTNLAAYKSTDPTATGCYLRIDDTNATDAKWNGYETMTDFGTGTGMFPTTTQIAQLYARKSSTTDSVSRPWWLIGDGKLFYLFVSWSPSYLGNCDVYLYGDFLSYKSGDAFNCMISGNVAATPSYPGHYNYFSICALSSNQSMFIPRSYSQIGSSVYTCKVGSHASGSFGIGGIAYPSPVDNGVMFHYPVFLTEGNSTTNPVATSPIRGYLPGLLQPVNNLPYVSGDTMSNVDGFSGKELVFLTPAYSTSKAVAAFDLTGPWR